MKTHKTEDNLIADKLSSLSDLPSDYSPNLESKWDVLETSLNENRKNKSWYFYSLRIAASILLTGLLILFFKNKENKTETILISKAVLNNQKPILKKNISSEQIANPSLETTKLKTSPLKKSVKSKNLLLNEEVTITQNSEPKTDTAPKEESVAQIEEQQQPFQKRKKARYIQLDFDDSETVHKTVPVPSFYSSNFQIKFLKQSPPDEVGMHEQSENKPLRIKL